MTAIALVIDRDKLKPRREPYWFRHQLGCYLGFRKMTATSGGTWLARFLDTDSGKQHYKKLGEFSEVTPAKRFDMAKAEADKWFKHLGKGGSTDAATVRDACERYIEQLKASKGETSRAAKDAEARFNAYVFDQPKLTRVELSKLTPAHVEGWRKSLRERPTTSGSRRGEQRSDSSLNRDMTCFRAALNLAYRDGHVTSDFAWRGKLIPIKAADKRRTDYLDAAQRRKLVAHAGKDLADFLRAMSLIPIRPGALAALTAGDFSKRLKTLRVGKDKSGGDRTISLPDSTAEFFSVLSKDKLPGAPLLARSNGKAWDKDAWKYPIREAVTAAKLPSSVTAYTMRHSVITDLMNSGLDPLTVGQLSGTSLVMIQRHYGHLTQRQARKALSKLSL